jgi:hypothetical protein
MKETLIEERLKDVLEDGDSFTVSRNGDGVSVTRTDRRMEEAYGSLVAYQKKVTHRAEGTLWIALLLYLVTVILIQKDLLAGFDIHLHALRSFWIYAGLFIGFFIVQQRIYNAISGREYRRVRENLLQHLRELDIDLRLLLARYEKDSRTFTIRFLLALEVE